MKKKKALLLMSGGLDSVLSAYVMKEQNIASTVLFFVNPFNACDGGCGNKVLAENTANKLGMPFMTYHLNDRYLDIVSSPRHGYGKNMNPCIDCRIHMLENAKKIMENEEYDFIVTGEVLGQRPMSQHLKAMQLIENAAGLEGLILRPLSANMLEPTIPELRGWIKRSILPSISGRSRKKQFELAQKFGIVRGDYASPAGGCRLTMREYSNKVRDLLKYNKKIKLNDVLWLNKGRHFRIAYDFKMVVGRNKTENEILEKLATDSEVKMQAKDYMGPLCVGIGNISEEKLKIMAGICGRYSDGPDVENILFIYYYNGKENFMKAFSFDHNRVLGYKI